MYGVSFASSEQRRGVSFICEIYLEATQLFCFCLLHCLLPGRMESTTVAHNNTVAATTRKRFLPHCSFGKLN